MTTYDHIHPHRPFARRRARAGVATQRTALVLGVVAWAVVVVITWSPAMAGLALVPATVVAAHDLRTRVVPDQWVVATVSFALVGAVITAGGDGALAALVGATAAGLPHLVVHLASPPLLGFGDVKLAAALGATVGPGGSAIDEQLLLAMMFVSNAAAVAIAAAAVSGRRDLPHAPALVVAAMCVMLVADRLGAVPA